MRFLLIIFIGINLYGISDSQLQEMALKYGLKPVPKDYNSLLVELNTSQKELSKEKIILGKKLFFEKDSSLGRDMSCASCHSFKMGGADGIPTAIGHKKRKNPFHLNTPTFFNTGFSKIFFWNGSSKSLKEQAKGPLQATFEMSITPQLAEKRIRNKKEYRKLFQDGYGDKKITFERIVEAIGSFEKTVVTKGKFDDFLYGDLNALNTKEKEGLNLFIKKSCIGCHNGIGLGGQEMRKFPMSHHVIWSMKTPNEIKQLQEKYYRGLKKSKKEKQTLEKYLNKKDLKLIEKGFFHQLEKEKRWEVITTVGCIQCHNEKTHIVSQDLMKNGFPFVNKGGFTGEKNYFRVPLLRNIVHTSPYFHNGSVKTLEEAIKIMGIHQSRVELSDEEIDTIVTFLKAVDGDITHLQP